MRFEKLEILKNELTLVYCKNCEDEVEKKQLIKIG